MDNDMKKLLLIGSLCAVVIGCVALSPVTISDGHGHVVTITPPSLYNDIAVVGGPTNTDIFVITRPATNNYKMTIDALNQYAYTNGPITNLLFTLSSPDGYWSPSYANGHTNYAFNFTNYSRIITNGSQLNLTNVNIVSISNTMKGTILLSNGANPYMTLYITNGLIITNSRP